jgi:hypothetical protein
MICSSLYLLVLMSIILQCDGLLGKMSGTVYGGQVMAKVRLTFKHIVGLALEVASRR